MTLKIALIVFLIPFVYLITPLLLGKKGQVVRWITIAGMGALSAIVITFLANDPDFILQDQLELMKRASSVESAAKDSAKLFLKQNLIAIDVAGSKMIHPGVDPTTKTNVSESITDRQALTTLFDTLNHHIDEIDLVVLDIGFETPLKEDCELYDQLFHLSNAHKLLCAKPSIARSDSCTPLPPAIFGDVAEKTQDNVVTSHQIYKHEHYSLPYLIYSKIAGIDRTGIGWINLLTEVTSKLGSSHSLNVFIPKPYLSDTDFIRPVGHDPAVLQANIPGSYDESLNFWQLNDLTNNGSLTFLANDLQVRKRSHMRNILLIGQFVGKEDLYTTAYGKRHGVAIIANTVYSLLHGDHHLRPGIILTIFVVFTFIFWLTTLLKALEYAPTTTHGLLPDKLIIILENLNRWFEQSNENRTTFSKAFDFGKAIITLFVEQFHLIILTLTVIILYKHTLINGLSFILYFSIFSRLLSHFFKYSGGESHRSTIAPI